MKWDISSARPAQWREASRPVVAVGLFVLVILALLGWTRILVVACATALIVLTVVDQLGRRRSSAREQEHQLAEVTARIRRIDAERREARARMHAIRSTVAGIVSANQLLKSLPEDRRESFESMVDAELDRLTRMLRDDATARIRPLALDDLLANVVTAHRSRGRLVSWQPSGVTAVGRYDDVAEAINILIDNAAVHGAADDIEVGVEQHGAEVTVAVTDGGAGIPAHLRSRIFSWGEHRADSPGEGIGLNMAQTLVREFGGDLRLDPTFDAGARFLLTLPAAVPAPSSVTPELHIA